MASKKKPVKKNPHLGTSFDTFLKDEEIHGEVTSAAVKRSLALELQKVMESQSITKVEMARRMETSRSHLNRLLDPTNDRIQLNTLYKAASVLGKRLKLELI